MHHSAVQLLLASGHVEISDVDLGGKNLHQGQAMGHDLLTDTEKERISLSIFFDCNNQFTAKRKVFIRQVFILKLHQNY